MSLTLEMPTTKAPKRKSRISVILLLILIACLIAFFAWLYSGRIVSENSILSAGFVPVPAPMSSGLAEVLVNPNAYVQTGQLLAKLEAGDYMQQMAAAQALVQGTIDTNTLNAERVAAAQKAAEDMVERIALARHEEGSRKAIVEQRSIEHAKALLNMRNIDAKGGTEAEKATARQKEAIAKQNLQNAKATFEHASQSRSAIEAELHAIRNSKNVAKQNPMPIQLPDPTLIHAPINGYLTQNIPLAGQNMTKGDAVFQIIPESGAKLHATAQLSLSDAKNITSDALCFVRPSSGLSILSGEIMGINKGEDPVSISINLRDEVDAKNLSIENSARTVLWEHPLAKIEFLKPLFMLLSYIPI